MFKLDLEKAEEPEIKLSTSSGSQKKQENFIKKIYFCFIHRGIPGGSDSKASACNAGDLGSIPGSGRSPGEGNGNPVKYSCLENPMDGEAWWATVHGVAKNQTQLSDFISSA